MYDFSIPAEAPGTCPKCKGTGAYSWGGSLNGKAIKSGTCFSCSGTAPTASDWIEVSPDGGWTRYDVKLNAAGEGAHWVAVHKLRRATMTEYTQTIKPGSNNWWRAVKLAHAAHD
jgi:hypothetical protein